MTVYDNMFTHALITLDKERFELERRINEGVKVIGKPFPPDDEVFKSLNEVILALRVLRHYSGATSFEPSEKGKQFYQEWRQKNGI